MKQARSYQWTICRKCGASHIAGRPCDLCRSVDRLQREIDAAEARAAANGETDHRCEARIAAGRND